MNEIIRPINIEQQELRQNMLDTFGKYLPDDLSDWRPIKVDPSELWQILDVHLDPHDTFTLIRYDDSDQSMYSAERIIYRKKYQNLIRQTTYEDSYTDNHGNVKRSRIIISTMFSGRILPNGQTDIPEAKYAINWTELAWGQTLRSDIFHLGQGITEYVIAESGSDISAMSKVKAYFKKQPLNLKISLKYGSKQLYSDFTQEIFQSGRRKTRVVDDGKPVFRFQNNPIYKEASSQFSDLMEIDINGPFDYILARIKWLCISYMRNGFAIYK